MRRLYVGSKSETQVRSRHHVQVQSPVLTPSTLNIEATPIPKYNLQMANTNSRLPYQSSSYRP
jgi:hypothetical protein